MPKENTLYTLYVVCKKDYIWSSSRFFGFTSNGWDSTWTIWLLSSGVRWKKWEIRKITNISGSTYRNYVSMYAKTEATFNYITEYFDIYLEEWNVNVASNTALAENLFKLSSNYVDEQEILWWNITRKVAVKVLTGNETYTYASSSNSVYLIANWLSGLTGVLPWYSTHFKCAGDKAGVASLSDWEFCYSHAATNINNATTGNIWLCSTTLWSDETTAKAWLKEQYANWTPVILVYPLATATTETVAGKSLQFAKWKNTVQIIEAWMEWLELWIEYKAIV